MKVTLLDGRWCMCCLDNSNINKWTASPFSLQVKAHLNVNSFISSNNALGEEKDLRHTSWLPADTCCSIQLFVNESTLFLFFYNRGIALLLQVFHRFICPWLTVFCAPAHLENICLQTHFCLHVTVMMQNCVNVPSRHDMRCWFETITPSVFFTFLAWLFLTLFYAPTKLFKVKLTFFFASAYMLYCCCMCLLWVLKNTLSYMPTKKCFYYFFVRLDQTAFLCDFLLQNFLEFLTVHKRNGRKSKIWQVWK